MSEPVEIRAPSEQTEGTRSQILRWLKRPGETVREHEPLIEIETDKVTVEVAAPASGVLLEILRQEQEEIEPGALLGTLEPQAAAGTPKSAVPGERPGGAPERPVPATRESGAAASAHRPAQPAASPAVRRLLAEHGLEAAAIAGTGEGGRITVEDVLHAAAASPGHAPGERAQSARSQPAGANDVRAHAHPLSSALGAPDSGPRIRSVPHSAVRRRTAA
ncbi:MAG: E3 binding domain-containing protein, partial [Gammaproteobacteria bacterium]|nr:E3 binding domain-containing protein [Gammaproteobacteria bacterium]